jgi:hypothetical protein
MKFTCFIDTCSYIYLVHDDCYVNGKTLLYLLNNEVTIRHSYEVNNEISRNYNPLMPDSGKRAAQVYRLKNRRINTYREYENRLFDSISDRGDENRGEKHNLAAIIDCFIADRKIGLIYLTDDNSALRGVLKNSVYCFPLYQIWNSYDVVLYLFIKHKHFGKDFAKAAIRNISAELAKSSTPQTAPHKTEERIKIFKSYINRLERINKLIRA